MNTGISLPTAPSSPNRPTIRAGAKVVAEPCNDGWWRVESSVPRHHNEELGRVRVLTLASASLCHAASHERIYGTIADEHSQRQKEVEEGLWDPAEHYPEISFDAQTERYQAQVGDQLREIEEARKVMLVEPKIYLLRY